MHQRSAIMKCQLCDLELESVQQVRIHLLSKLHRDRETQIEYAKK
jgi:ribosomal protein L34E